jgi:hypothetical protein
MLSRNVKDEDQPGCLSSFAGWGRKSPSWTYTEVSQHEIDRASNAKTILQTNRHTSPIKLIIIRKLIDPARIRSWYILKPAGRPFPFTWTYTEVSQHEDRKSRFKMCYQEERKDIVFQVRRRLLV